LRVQNQQDAAKAAEKASKAAERELKAAEKEAARSRKVAHLPMGSRHALRCDYDKPRVRSDSSVRQEQEREVKAVQKKTGFKRPQELSKAQGLMKVMHIQYFCEA